MLAPKFKAPKRLLVSKRNLLFQQILFRFHVKLRGCNQAGFHISYNKRLAFATASFVGDSFLVWELGVSFSWRPNTDKRCRMLQVYLDSDILERSRRTDEYEHMNLNILYDSIYHIIMYTLPKMHYYPKLNQPQTRTRKSRTGVARALLRKKSQLVTWARKNIVSVPNGCFQK